MVLALGFGPAPAYADAATDDQRARTHYIAGESHFAAGRWGDAVREFTLAYELSQRQEMLINRSRAYERNGQLEEARDDLALLLDRYPESRYRDEAEARTERLRRAIAARPPVEEKQEPAPSQVPATAIAAVPADPRAEAPPPPAAPPARASKRPSWPVLALGGGAVALGAIALGTGLKAHGIYGDLEARCMNGRCPADLAADRDRGHTLAKLSTGITFGAVALLAGAIGVYVHQLRKLPDRVDVALDASPQRGEARLKVRF